MIFDLCSWVSFRMFCNAVSKEGKIAKRICSYFLNNHVSGYFHFVCLFRYLKTEIIVRNRDSGGWHLTVSAIQQLVQAIPWRQSKESIESHLVKDRVDWSVIKKNKSCNKYQSHFTLFTGFKRESTQDSDEYNLAIWAVNLFDILDLNI